MNSMFFRIVGWPRRWFWLVLAWLSVGAAWAAPFQNGSFETGTDPVSFTNVVTGSTSITGWTVTSGNVDYIGTYWTAADGTRSVDLNGTGTGRTGTIAQTFDTVAGHRYVVQFALAGNPDTRAANMTKTMRVQATGSASADYTFNATGHTLTAMGWTDQIYAFTATGTSTTLTFASLMDTEYGPVIDNIRVDDVTVTAVDATITPVPVPTVSTWMLALLSGGILLLGLARRKSQR